MQRLYGEVGFHSSNIVRYRGHNKLNELQIVLPPRAILICAVN